MRLFLVLFGAMLLQCSIAQEQLDAIVTPAQAREFASDNMWTDVQLLSKEECRWLMNPDGSKDAEEPKPGDVSVVRNSAYKLIVDTQFVVIQCAVIDFDMREMTEVSIDSIRHLMMSEYKRHGSFEQLAKDHLPKDEMFRYQEFSAYSHQIKEMLGETFQNKKQGDVFFHELPDSGNFKFVILIRKDPKSVDGFIVLRTRLTEK